MWQRRLRGRLRSSAQDLGRARTLHLLPVERTAIETILPSVPQTQSRMWSQMACYDTSKVRVRTRVSMWSKAMVTACPTGGRAIGRHHTRAVRKDACAICMYHLHVPSACAICMCHLHVPSGCLAGVAASKGGGASGGWHCRRVVLAGGGAGGVGVRLAVGVALAVATLAAEAAEESLRAAMMAAPRFWTVPRKSPCSQSGGRASRACAQCPGGGGE